MFTGMCASTCLRSHAAWVIMAANKGPDNCRGPGWIFVVWGVSVGGRKWADQTAEDCFGLKETCEVEAWIQAVCVHWQRTSSYLSLLYNFLKGGTAWILRWDMICHYHVSLKAVHYSVSISEQSKQLELIKKCKRWTNSNDISYQGCSRGVKNTEVTSPRLSHHKNFDQKTNCFFLSFWFIYFQ